MAALNSWVEKVDQQLAQLVSEWNLYTSIIALVVLIFTIYPLVIWTEPDIHPMLLARQSNPSRVRQPKESAVYRSLETPHEFPLKTGLSVRDADTPKYGRGRDGDLRDVWLQALRGSPDSQGDDQGRKAKVLTVLGKDEVVTHDLENLTAEINAIGHYLKDRNAQRVAVYLPNSLELLLSVFASAFYLLTPILLPYNSSHALLEKWLRSVQPDVVIAAAGSFSSVEIAKLLPSLKEIIWVVEPGSRHMDWNEDSVSSSQTIISVWHDIVEKTRQSAEQLPPRGPEDHVPGLVTVWQDLQGDEISAGEVVEYSQANIVAGVAAAISALPSKQRLSASDVFMPADSLSYSYALIQTFAAFFQNASIALNSVSGPAADLNLVTRSVAPTVILASKESIARTYGKDASQNRSILSAIRYWRHSAALAEGRMPRTVANKTASSSIGTEPGKLRLILVSDRAGPKLRPLKSEQLSRARILSGARIVYALTASKVAGAVSQTSLYDYRGETGQAAHFGVPLSALEVKLVDTPTHKTVEDEEPLGEVVVNGPAVIGEDVRIGVTATFRNDCVLALA